MAEHSLSGTIDEAQCRRFEAGWRQGQPQPLEAFLPSPGDPNFLFTLEELIAMELEWAWKRWQGQGGERPAQVEDYCARFPQLPAPSLIRLLQQEYLVRRQAGDAPSFAEFGERFPDLMDAGKTIGDLLNMAHTRTLELGGPEGSPGPRPVFQERARGRLPDLPGFEILEELGRGGMGVVYKARQRNLQRVVALKMILQGTHASTEELTRFQAEAEAVARLQHPNIVQIYEIGQHDGMPFLSLEFVNGGTLAQAMRKQPQAIRPAAQLVETLARAVHWAHEHGIVHRDLKPANILLQTVESKLQIANPKERPDANALKPGSFNLQSAIPKITDFGLAKRLESDVQHTKTGAVLGTPAYMAPEQAAGKTKEIGPRVDVYALGTILYEMLTGQAPFAGDSLLEILEKVKTQEPARPTRLQPRIHRDLETICLKAMAREPEQRYATALALADDLARFNAGEPILARPESRVRMVWRRLARHRVAAVFALAVLLAGAAAGWFILNQNSQTQAQNRLSQRIQDSLENLALNPAALEKLEQDLDRLEALDAQQAVSARQRFYQRLTRVLRDRIWTKQVREELTDLQAALDFLEKRQPDLVPELRREFAGRLSGWEPVFELAAPFDRLDKVFPPGRVKTQDGVLVPAYSDLAPGNAAQVILCSPPSQNNAELTALFDKGWDKGAEVGLWINALQGHNQPVRALSFSPDGRLLASASGGGNVPGEVKVWDLGAGQERYHYLASTTGTLSVAFSPKGKYLAVGQGQDPSVKLLEATTGKLVRSIKGHEGGVSALAFAADGMTLATGSVTAKQVGEIRLWDPETGEAKGEFHGHTQTIARLTFSPDGHYLASSSHDRTVRVWDLTAGQQRWETFPVHMDMPPSLVFTPDSRTLAAPVNWYKEYPGSIIHPLTLWDTATGTLRQFNTGFNCGGISALSLAPDGHTMAVASIWGDKEVRLCDLNTGKWRSFLVGGRKRFSYLALEFSPDGTLLATGDEDHAVKLWRVSTGQLRQSLASRGFHFQVRSLSSREKSKDREAPPPLETIREARGDFYLTILRNGVVLSEQTVPAHQLPSGPLRLRAKRDGASLFFHVNEQVVLEGQDVLPLGESEMKFGVHWPGAVGLLRLSATAQSLPASPTLLEQGDDLYTRGQFFDARVCFRQHALTTSNVPARQEARMKESLCLLALQQFEDAAQVLGTMAQEEGPRWPAVATCQLLMLHVQQRRFPQANALFERLAAKHRFDEVSPLVPRDFRDQLVLAYADDFRGLEYAFRPRATELAGLDHARTLFDFFQVPKEEWFPLELATLRLHHMAGRLKPALDTTKRLLADPEYWRQADVRDRLAVHQQAAWLLRQQGQPQAALERIDELFLARPGVDPKEFLCLLPERARTYEALNQWDEAEKDLDAFLQHPPTDRLAYGFYAEGWLAWGFLLERKGAAPAAQEEAWKKGLYTPWSLARLKKAPEEFFPPLGQRNAPSILYGMILGALTGDLTDQKCSALLADIVRRSTDQTPLARLHEACPLPASVLREMWRGPRGRAWAKKIAWQDLTYEEYLRLPVQLGIYQFLRQEAFPRDVDAVQDELLWALSAGLHAAYASDKLGPEQITHFITVWTGAHNKASWQALEANLQPEVKGALAYVLGQRATRLNKDADAVMWFRAALANAAPGTSLHRLASTEIDRRKGL